MRVIFDGRPSGSLRLGVDAAQLGRKMKMPESMKIRPDSDASLEMLDSIGLACRASTKPDAVLRSARKPVSMDDLNHLTQSNRNRADHDSCPRHFPIFPQYTSKIPVRLHQNSRSFSRRFPQNVQKSIFPQKLPQLREIGMTIGGQCRLDRCDPDTHRPHVGRIGADPCMLL